MQMNIFKFLHGNVTQLLKLLHYHLMLAWLHWWSYVLKNKIRASGSVADTS